MKILLLCEGDAESQVGSFSGISKSVVDGLRAAGDEVNTANCDLTGLDRYLAAIPMFSPSRSRWGSRYHLGGWPFKLRSRRARIHYERHQIDPDVILQFGATFRSPGPDRLPYFLYCDSNVRVAEAGGATGFSSTSPLTRAEIADVARREQTVYSGATAVFTLSEHLRDSFLGDFGLPPERVIAVGAGPNLDVNRLPERSTLADSPPTVLFVGGKFRRKGGDLLLRAFSNVRQRIPDARLTIIGPSDFEVTQPGVECLGFLRKDVPRELNSLRRAYEDAHVFCLPTRFEPFGIAFLEAMFHSLPCIGPKAWAVPEMVLDGETGYTVPPEDVDALTDRLLHLLEHPDEASRLGAAGRRYAESRFTWEKAVTSMRSTMAGAIGHPAPS